MAADPPIFPHRKRTLLRGSPFLGPDPPWIPSGSPADPPHVRAVSARTVGSNGRFERSVQTAGSSGQFDRSARTVCSTGRLERPARTVGSNGRLERSVRSVGSNSRLERSAGTVGSNGRLERSARTVASNGRSARTGGFEQFEQSVRTVGSNGRFERSVRTVGSNGRLQRSVRSVGQSARTVGWNGRFERSARTVGSNGRLERTARTDGSNGRHERSARLSNLRKLIAPYVGVRIAGLIMTSAAMGARQGLLKIIAVKTVWTFFFFKLRKKPSPLCNRGGKVFPQFARASLYGNSPLVKLLGALGSSLSQRGAKVSVSLKS